MKGKRIDENRMRELVRLGSDFAPVPENTEAKVLAAIREKTASRPRLSIVRLFRYSPALAAAAVLVVILPLAAVLAGTLLFPGAARYPLIAVSDKGGAVTGRETPLRFGDVFAEKDVIRTGAGEQVALERKGLIALQLFSNSTLEIAGFAETRRGLALRLGRGALYVNKTAPPDDRSPVTVAIDAYTFALKGTRVYFSVNDRRVIHIICYDGLIETMTGQGKTGKLIFSLNAGEKAEIKPDGGWTIVRTFTREERTLDEDLRGGLPRLKFIKEISFDGAAPAVLPEREKDEGETVPPYTVTAVGNIAAKQEGEEGARFYGAAEAGGRVFLVNQESVFTLDAAGVTERPGLVKAAAFMVRPFAAGRYVAFAKPGSIALVDPDALKPAAEVTLPKNGSIDHNFLPCAAAAGQLCVPVQNNGYYVMDPEARPASLRLLVEEPFPLGPAADGAVLYIGSYYTHFVAGINPDGSTVFKTQLKGSTAVNLVVRDQSLYVHTAEPAGYFIIRLNEAGRETGRWKLDAALKADFREAGGKLIGLYGDGRLFVLDPANGRIGVIDRVFRKTLTSRQWRNAGLCVRGNLVYAPTDRGSLLAVDVLRGKTEEEIFVKPKEEFFTAPFFYRDTLYAVADSGTVYRIVKNAR
jgi:hypothetical protein